MEQVLTYILQVNLLLVIIYLGYVLLLKGLTFYQMNRVYFITGIIFAFSYPFLDISALFSTHIEPVGEMLAIADLFVAQDTSAHVLTLSNVVLAVIFGGACVCLLRFVVQLFSLLRVHLKSQPARWQSFIYRNVLFPIVPFSFFNSIYLNKDQHQEGELMDIFKHEDVHVKGRHTLDILLTELVLILCWYNPLVWLLRRAVRQNLEFLTDQLVLDKGVDRQVYQYSLLHVTKQGLNASLANQFNFKMLKQRIMMMNKKRSSKLQLSKYVFLVPVFIFVAGAFTMSKADDRIVEVVKYTESTDLHWLDTKSPQAADTVPVRASSEGNTAVSDIKGYLLDGKLVTAQEITALDDKSIENVVIHVNNELSEKYGFSSVLQVTTKAHAGTVGTPSRYKSISFDDDGELILEGPLKVASSKEDAKVRIRGYKLEESDSAQDHIDYRMDQLNKTTRVSIDTRKPLFFIDGKPVPNIDGVNPDNIQSVDILKDSSAMAIYGPKARDGVVLITSKKSSGKSNNHVDVTTRDTSKIKGVGVFRFSTSDTTQSNSVKIRVRGKDSPAKDVLFVVDGEVVPDLVLESINPTSIESVTVLKDASATALYGDKGKNGVVLIATKKSLKKQKSGEQD